MAVMFMDSGLATLYSCFIANYELDTRMPRQGYNYTGFYFAGNVTQNDNSKH